MNREDAKGAKKSLLLSAPLRLGVENLWPGFIQSPFTDLDGYNLRAGVKVERG